MFQQAICTIFELSDYRDLGTEQRKLVDWYQQAMASGVRVLQQFARLLLAARERILSWYDYPHGPQISVPGKSPRQQALPQQIGNSTARRTSSSPVGTPQVFSQSPW